MPVWVWVLLGLSAVGFALWLLDVRMGLDVTERFGKALTILLIVAILAVLALSFMAADWR